ncbi:hypothetical protein SAMN06265219_11255 [Gracilimonas mengyeensis]|uniref:Uncharacterized protein n=2 Tax=Gracilimonas mengyeensis TaxID=1302730 RepID=A0A521EJR5_9BACT|nr:hypothetical protein SAMN06265219_11255 [Gracilimonas mengyeensis]
MLLPLLGWAQPDFEDLQQQWLDILNKGEDVSEFYWTNEYQVFAELKVGEAQRIMDVVNSNENKLPGSYQQTDIFRHDEDRYVTVGDLYNEEDEILLVTGWRNTENGWKKEVDMYFSPEEETGNSFEMVKAKLDERRQEWIKLANAHNPQKHVDELYTQETVYLANGSKSEGRQEVADRYYFMKNPNYEIGISKTKLWNIAEGHVLETGRYYVGGDYDADGGVYVVLWELTGAGKWQVKLDFNF